MNKPIILAGLLALAACSDSPDQSFAKARSEFAAHDYATARVHVAAALAAQPTNQDMLLLQARTLLALGDGDGAGTALAKITHGKAPSGELAELAAEAALLRRAPKQALDLLGDAAGAEPERLRALAALQKQDLAAAQGHFEKAITAGGNARVFADYARLKLITGDMAGADEMAARATKADPDGIDTLLVNGVVRLRHGDLKASLDNYDRANRLYPTSLAALSGKAAVLGDLGRLDEMDAVLGKAVALAPRDPTVTFIRAKAKAVRKDWAGVRAAIQPIEGGLGQLDPLRQIYGEALLRLGQPDLAIAQLQPIVRTMPGNREAVRLLGEAQLAAGDARAALATMTPLANFPAARPEELALAAKAARAAGDPSADKLEARAKLPPARAMGQDLVDGDTAMRAGNWAGAVAAYQRILAITDGSNVVVVNNMAYAETMLGNHEMALDYSRRALKLAPNNPSVLDTAGYALFKSGKDTNKGREMIRRAAQLAPKNATIRAHLSEVERAPG